ncbi:MAG: hypothetical protein HUU16_21820 [Candidatus Omnitrophica bacterium]|nr:hypothetical protein [Candidatus Omnitrophota bacterium]
MRNLGIRRLLRAGTLLAGMVLCMGGARAGNGDWYSVPQPIHTRALLTDPVFTPSNIADAFHMNPTFLYPNDFLRAGEFDYDFSLGTFGTDGSKAGTLIYLDEDTEHSVYANLGYRVGILNEIGGLRLPVELYAQLPAYILSGDISSWGRPNTAAGFTFVDELDEDVALGKLVTGLRIGIIPETAYIPSLSFQGSLGWPIDDDVATNGVDSDIRLQLEKHFPRGFAGILYAGRLFPHGDADVFDRVGVGSQDDVPYIGAVIETNIEQLMGAPDPGHLWFHFGGVWRDQLYDFGSEGPDHAEEVVKSVLNGVRAAVHHRG